MALGCRVNPRFHKEIILRTIDIVYTILQTYYLN